MKTIIEKMQETKIMLRIRATPCVIQIHEISKMVIHHLWPSPQDKNQCQDLERTLRHSSKMVNRHLW